MAPILKPLIALALVLAIPAEAVMLYMRIQDVRVVAATAANARQRQQGEAGLAQQTARVQLQIARNAAALKKAEAETLFAQARTQQAVAQNARARVGYVSL